MGSSMPVLGAAFYGAMVFYVLFILVLVVIPAWKVFVKAGKPGWAILIPIYNAYIFCKICNRPGWWLLLLCIPFVNFVIAIILCIDLAKSFGKGAGFAIGLVLLGFIFLPILGFGKAEYKAIERQAA